MRKAMRGPALLWARVEVEAAAQAAALEAGFWGGPGQGGARWAQVEEDGAWWVLGAWDRGEDAKAAWVSWVTSAGWRAAAGELAGQPRVHVVVWDGRPAPVWEGPGVLLTVTADATVTTRADRRSAPRPEASLRGVEELPEVPGGALLPVIGHPGRLVGWSMGWDEAAAAALEAAWGPWVEAAEVYAVRRVG